jgi:hypothetical protein
MLPSCWDSRLERRWVHVKVSRYLYSYVWRSSVTLGPRESRDTKEDVNGTTISGPRAGLMYSTSARGGCRFCTTPYSCRPRDEPEFVNTSAHVPKRAPCIISVRTRFVQKQICIRRKWSRRTRLAGARMNVFMKVARAVAGLPVVGVPSRQPETRLRLNWQESCRSIKRL